MKSARRWLSVLVTASIFLDLALGSTAWAKAYKARTKEMDWGSRPRVVDSVKVRQDQEKVNGDLSQLRQHKQDFQKQMATLKGQRTQTLKSKNKEQAKAIVQQIQQLKQQGQAQLRQDRIQLAQDRHQLRQDERGQPQQDSGGRHHHSKHLK